MAPGIANCAPPTIYYPQQFAAPILPVPTQQNSLQPTAPPPSNSPHMASAYGSYLPSNSGNSTANQPKSVMPASSPNGSSSGGGGGNSERDPLSRTNLYIRGLSADTTDADLANLCAKYCRYGKVVSTKAIIDQSINKCKGYGFVDFDNDRDAELAIKELQSQGIQAQMAKQQEQDPTNLYLANLPASWTESTLNQMLNVPPYAPVISARILRDPQGASRCVGFARMSSRDKCDLVIQHFNGQVISKLGGKEPLLVKFADGGNKKKNNKSLSVTYDASALTANGLTSLLPSIMPAAQLQGLGSGFAYPGMQQLVQPQYLIQPQLLSGHNLTMAGQTLAGHAALANPAAAAAAFQAAGQPLGAGQPLTSMAGGPLGVATNGSVGMAGLSNAAMHQQFQSPNPAAGAAAADMSSQLASQLPSSLQYAALANAPGTALNTAAAALRLPYALGTPYGTHLQMSAGQPGQAQLVQMATLDDGAADIHAYAQAQHALTN